MCAPAQFVNRSPSSWFVCMLVCESRMEILVDTSELVYRPCVCVCVCVCVWYVCVWCVYVCARAFQGCIHM